MVAIISATCAVISMLITVGTFIFQQYDSRPEITISIRRRRGSSTISTGHETYTHAFTLVELVAVNVGKSTARNVDITFIADGSESPTLIIDGPEHSRFHAVQMPVIPANSSFVFFDFLEERMHRVKPQKASFAITFTGPFRLKRHHIQTIDFTNTSPLFA